MNVDKDDVTIIGTAVAWLVAVWASARGYEKLSGRVDALESKPPSVPLTICEERRAQCGKVNSLQFEHGSTLFDELKKEISDTRAESQAQHKEIMKFLMEMNR